MAEPTVYILTVSHNRVSSTRAFCESLGKQTYRRFVLVLVDDASTDGTVDIVRTLDFPVSVCRGNGNLWWAGGLRRGLARLKAIGPRADDLVMIANDDTTFPPDFLRKAVDEMAAARPGTMMCVSVKFVDSDRWTDGGTVCKWPRFTFRHYGRHPERIDCASTRCLFAFHQDLAVVGSFRPRLLPQYLSDYEYTIRAHRGGITLAPAHSVVCEATEHTTGSHRPKPGSVRAVTAQMLSPRFSANPVTLFMFVLLAAPAPWKLVCWCWAARTVAAFFLRAAILDRLGPWPFGRGSTTGGTRGE